MLLNIPKGVELPNGVKKYLDSNEGQAARASYKCRSRRPWYCVPDVHVPDYFLTYMSGAAPKLVLNMARCTCTNSVHLVRLRDKQTQRKLYEDWRSPITALSCEVEGHPLGGGLLKLEPKEAGRVLLPDIAVPSKFDMDTIERATEAMRSWRHVIASARPDEQAVLDGL